MPLEIIGAGLGRTGTMSLKVAIEKLGLGPCYHMAELFADPSRIPAWLAAADGRQAQGGGPPDPSQMTEMARRRIQEMRDKL
jgi:hypothetical protein